MKISNQNTNLINQTYGKNQTPVPSSKDRKNVEKSPESTRNIDSVSLSPATKDLQKIEQAMGAEPPGRSERVATLKAAVENGRYKVDPEAVAERMAGFFIDKIA
ncbi:MAG: flagellar biosynthesis anti-sigma factor FlgM [Desulfobacterium sp.]|jgi:negative regulator of flagellin synthesis FlgM|nr:flagellar biosynthesis anti-sigma factor FlgM [Desulfobacterium sp.]